MEALQMLKFSFKKQQLNFMSDYQAPPVGDDEDHLHNLATASRTDTENLFRKNLMDVLADADTTDIPDERNKMAL
jgi:hypothetical protein